MVIVHAENPQSPGQIHRKAAIAAVDAQEGGQIVGLGEFSWGCEGQTCRPQQAGREQQRERPHSSHPAAMLGQQGPERLGENGTGVRGVGGGQAAHTYTLTKQNLNTTHGATNVHRNP